jgi:hypothetical protein
MYDAGQPSISYFYFDFRSSNKQHLHDLLPSLLTQLSTNSSPRCDILLHLYETHDGGKTQPSDRALAECLKEMLILPDQPPIYLIMDALDECPTTSGIPSDRERVLQLVACERAHRPRPSKSPYMSPAARRSTYGISLILSLLSAYLFTIKVDKRKTS